MLLSDTGLKLGSFEPALAAALGNEAGYAGSRVVAETVSRGGSVVGIRDWLYCLIQQPGAALRREFIENPGKRAERFIEQFENALDEDPAGLPPERLTSTSASRGVISMLEMAERIAEENAKKKSASIKVTDKELSRALLDSADAELTRLLTIWASEDGLKAFKAKLKLETEPPEVKEIWLDDGRLDRRLFAPSGRQFCDRMQEDTASMAASKVTTRHTLYTILSNADGILPLALAMTGVDVKRDLHAVLTRELAGKPGKRRVEDFQLTKDTIFDAVADVLMHAQHNAAVRGAKGISEGDIHKAFLSRQLREITRLFQHDKPMDVPAVRSYVETAELEEEEEHASGRQMPVGEIERLIRERICGQDAAISQVVPWIKRLRFGLPRDGRPAAVFLFLGPTGTGKTQLAKELARYVYGDEDMLIYLEMGQFKTKEAMNMFIGAAPGYVGYGDGKLTNGLRDKPQSVVLFDEIEKADIQVFDTLLRFCDEGMISDPAGPVRDGRKCIIVMTTNAGQGWLRAYLAGETDEKGKGLNPDPPQEKKEDFEQKSIQIKSTAPTEEADDSGELAVTRINDPRLPVYLFNNAVAELQRLGFRPEFLGRVDERVTFVPFTRATCLQIINGGLNREIEKIKKLKGIEVEVDKDARDILAKMAHIRSMDEGARGAPRAINEQIITRLIDELSDEDADGGARTTHVVFSGDKEIGEIRMS